MWIKIETYWNVNTLQKDLGYEWYFIKIETYWNVNEDDKIQENNKEKLK